MKHVLSVLLGLGVVVLLIAAGVDRAAAARGVPGSPAFAIGAAMPLNPTSLEAGIAAGAELHSDWTLLPLSWAVLMPQPGAAQWDLLDRAVAAAVQQQTPVVISLSEAPAWAQTPQGPDAAQTAALVAQLVGRYGTALQAVELFPRANTRAAWGAAANPAAYLTLLAQVQAAAPSLQLVAAGLQPLAVVQTGDMSDAAFLQGLYDAGGAPYLTVVSMQLPQTADDLMQMPSEQEPRVLRRYETLRRVMTTNNHPSALLWITHLDRAAAVTDVSQQVVWLQKAYTQVRSQLYISAAFFQNLNAPVQPGMLSLVQPDGSRHPFAAAYQTLLHQNNPDLPLLLPGRSKEGALLKNRS